MIIEELFKLLNTEKPFNPYNFYRGKMFSAIEDSEGNIGISASPDFPKDDDGAKLYLSRIIMQCRINSRLNQMNSQLCEKDFVESINFEKSKNILMAGFIRSVYNKLINNNIKCNVFDLNKDADELLPVQNMNDYLKQADTIICTGTAFANGTIDAMIKIIKPNAYLYIIGPSAPLSTVLFDWIPQLKGIFGCIVQDKEILPQILSDSIKNDFAGKLKKVCLLREATFRDMS